MLGTNLGPIGVQLLGYQRGEPGERALPELDVFHEHCDGVVIANAHKRIGSKATGRAVGAQNLRGARLRHRHFRLQIEPKHKTRHALERGAA
jgi:hypothetical protein